jgi:hypothetical protein
MFAAIGHALQEGHVTKTASTLGISASGASLRRSRTVI